MAVISPGAHVLWARRAALAVSTRPLQRRAQLGKTREGGTGQADQPEASCASRRRDGQPARGALEIIEFRWSA